MSRRMAVTGGTGFVGGAVIRAALQDGWEVHSYGRREVPGAEFRHWEALQRDVPSSEKYDVIVHCAAAATDWGREMDIMAVNVRGTRNALDIDRDARFIHISTASVYASEDRYTNMAREDSALPKEFLNIYARSKYAAEFLVVNDRRESGAVILRPHAIYGPGDTTLLPRVEKAVRGGKLLLPNSGWNLSSLTRIDNLVQVIMEMIEIPSPDHRVYNVADRKPVMLGPALKNILEKRGRKVNIAGMPSNVAWKIGASLEWLYKEMDAVKSPPLTRYLVSQLGYEQTLNLTRIQDQLGRKLPYSDFSDAAIWDEKTVLTTQLI